MRENIANMRLIWKQDLYRPMYLIDCMFVLSNLYITYLTTLGHNTNKKSISQQILLSYYLARVG